MIIQFNYTISIKKTSNFFRDILGFNSTWILFYYTLLRSKWHFGRRWYPL